jgi:hypothetical protein
MMRKGRFSEEQIIAILREQESGMATAEVCRRHGISSATFYAWKSIYGPPPIRKHSDSLLDLLVCLNLSGLFVERYLPLAMMASARPCPS